MPCNLVWSCFALDWNRNDPNCVTGGEWPEANGDGNSVGAVDNQPNVNNQDNNMAGTGGNNAGGVCLGSSPPSAAGVKPTARLKTVKTFRAYLPTCHRKYSCVHCRAHLANHDELISKSFQGSQGRAYLFNSVVNIGCGPAEERILLTGLHAVADIYCDCCKTTLGWKYEQAFESSQKYKEGKYIIELAHMIKENGWENES
jgi:hypothetical protein